MTYGRNLEPIGLVPSDPDYGNGIPRTRTGLEMYHHSHRRGNAIQARVRMMLACRDLGIIIFRARQHIKHQRVASLHRKCAGLHEECADMPRDTETYKSNLKVLELYEKYLPVAGDLSSQEYLNLVDGLDVELSSSNPSDSLAGEVCRACRNLNLRRETFQTQDSRFVSSIFSDLTPDGEYSDQELEKKIPHDPTCLTAKHHKLGSIKDLAKRPECSLCRLAADCFLRLSKDELMASGYEFALDDWCFNGVVWLSLLYDPVGDYPTRRYPQGQSDPEDRSNLLKSTKLTGRTRIILSIHPEGKEWKDFGEPPFDFLHTEIFELNGEEYSNFQSCRPSMAFFDTSRMQKWLFTCEKYHGEACSAPANHGNMKIHEDMLLIDLKDYCLVPGSRSRRYFVLSYMWGKSQRESLLTTKENFEYLIRPGGLSAYIGKISRTVYSAMQLTWEMKCRYLWVDALCIIQDDDEASKASQINYMDAIYRQAVLTIVAGDTLGAQFEISGIGTNPRETIQRTYSYRPGLTLTAKEAVIGDVEVRIMQSEWASRAWTFQERIFSRRLLIFVDSTVYWSCSCIRWSETEPNPSEDGPPPWEYYNVYFKGRQLTGENSINFVWQHMVENIADLKLTFEKDVLIAIAGLENYVAQYFDTWFIFGHPQLIFLDSLLWVTCTSTKPVRRRNAPQIPSWSWASIVGYIIYVEMRPHQKKYPRLRISTPTWENDSNSRASSSCTHSGILDIHTMVSKVHIVGSMRDERAQEECPEVGFVLPHLMPLAVMNQAGKCIGYASISLVDDDIDEEVEAIVLAEKLPDEGKESLEAPLSFWIMIIEWKGEIAERVGLGLVTGKDWQEMRPVWRDIKLR